MRPAALRVRSPGCLRMHAVIRPEESSGQRHQLTIARVIKRLNPGNAFGNIRMLALNVRRQLLLGIGRSGNQYCARVHEGLRHAFQKPFVHRRMTTATSIRLVMNMLVRMSAADRRGIHFRGVELKDSRLLMIDPDQSVIMLSDVESLRSKSHA